MTLKTRRDDLFALTGTHSPLKDPLRFLARLDRKKAAVCPKESLVVDYDPLAKSLGFSHKLSKKVVDPCQPLMERVGFRSFPPLDTESWPLRETHAENVATKGINVGPTSYHVLKKFPPVF